MIIETEVNVDEKRILELVSAFVREDEIEKIEVWDYNHEGQDLWQVDIQTIRGFQFRDYVTYDYELL